MANPNPNTKGLRPPKKGEIRNPKGRPKGSRNRETIVRKWIDTKEKIENPITGKSQRLTQADIMTLALIRKARRGDVAAFKELMDSAFGKITDKHDLTTGGEKITGYDGTNPEQFIRDALSENDGG